MLADNIRVKPLPDFGTRMPHTTAKHPIADSLHIPIRASGYLTLFEPPNVTHVFTQQSWAKQVIKFAAKENGIGQVLRTGRLNCDHLPLLAIHLCFWINYSNYVMKSDWYGNLQYRKRTSTVNASYYYKASRQLKQLRNHKFMVCFMHAYEESKRFGCAINST